MNLNEKQEKQLMDLLKNNPSTEPESVDTIYKELRFWLIESLCNEYEDVFQHSPAEQIFYTCNEKRFYMLTMHMGAFENKIISFEVFDSRNGEEILTIQNLTVIVDYEFYGSDTDYWDQKGGKVFEISQEDFETYYLLLESLFKRARKEIENNG